MTDLILENLRRAREILTPSTAWTQGSYAADFPHRNGDGTSPMSLLPADPRATCWCLHGAYAKASEVEMNEYSHFELDVAIKDCVPEEYRASAGAFGSAFNDAPGRTQAEVLAVLDCAIAKREAGL